MAITVSSVTSAGVITVSSTVIFSANQSVQLSGTPFGGLLAGTTYWIIAKTSNTLTLSSSLYGPALSTTAATGTMTIDAYRQSGPGVGNTISANTINDYNTLQNIANKVLGLPTDLAPTYGYNQSLLSSQVSGGTKITQNQWANLARDLVYARVHQTGSVNEVNNLPVPTTSNIVTEAFRKSYYDFANTVLQNANAVAPSGQTTIVNVGTAARSQLWNGNISSTVTLDFGSLAGTRSFFNTGGLVTIACTLTGTFGAVSAAKDNTWSGMFGAMGTIFIGPNSTYISGQSTSGYTSTPVNKGYFQLTTTSTLIFTQTPPSGAYAANSFKVFANMDGSGRYMTLTIQYNDDAGVSSQTSPIYGGDEYVDGVLTQYIGVQRASGSYVSVNPPSVSFAGDLTGVIGAPSLYGLSASAYNVNEGDSFTVYLQTQNVNDGVQLYYTVSGMNNTPNNVSRWSSPFPYFTVSNNAAQLPFTINRDLYTDGVSTMTIALSNGLASTSITVNDTSGTPTGLQTFSAVGTNQFTVPNGIYSLQVLLLAGGGGGGNRAGGGGGGGQARLITVSTTPGATFSVIVGDGGNAGSNGGTSYFGAYSSLGGFGGGSGSGTSGGAGGAGGNGTLSGGSASSVASNAAFLFAGGGGGSGQLNGAGGASGSNASGSTGGTGGYGVQINNFYGNNNFQITGGGEGGSTGANTGTGANYGGGQGGGVGEVGNAGSPNTGGGGGGGGVNISGGSAGVPATITGLAGGKGGSGLILVGWP